MSDRLEAAKLPDDGRTMAQRRADLLACWLTTNENGEPALGADIAVVIDTDDDVLEHQFIGRFAPEILDKALWFRDGTCQAPTCTRPAQQCDDDHQIPHPRGPTSGTSLWPLCRRHHVLTSHGVLKWIMPSGIVHDAERNTGRHTMDTARPGDLHLTRTTFEYVG